MIIKNTVKTALIILSTLSVVKALEKDALSHEAQGLPLVTIQQENREIIPVILCGGVGSRLWPISREQRPKPFMKLSDGQSFLQKALLRGTELPGVKKVMTVTNRDLFFQVRDEYEKAQPELQHTFLLEPFARNTAAAITLAALQAKADGKENSLMLVLAADHLIENQTNFKEAVLKASELAKGGKLVAFGIEPTRPETGYGYIQARGNNIIKFVEKPNLETATEYLESGDYVWNSGMFCFMPKTVLKEISQHYREILLSSERALTQAHKVAGDKVTQIDLSPEEFERVPICPIDTAVMEKTQNAAVVPCNIGWKDIGCWFSYSTLLETDAQNNGGNAFFYESQNCTVQTAGRFVGAVGLENVVIIDTPDALLVANKNSAQSVKYVYEHLKSSSNDLHKHHQTVHRPWGTYTILEESEGHKVKRIEVTPGAKLSLQLHNHRSEHWTVVAGTGKARNGDRDVILQKNESIFIPLKTVHRMENIGEDKLVFVEVQIGDYLGEDDIIRYEDTYGRR